jgi:hypothetical protein
MPIQLMEVDDQERNSKKREMMKESKARARDKSNDSNDPAKNAEEKPRITTDQFGEPETRQEGKPFDVTTGQRRREDESKDISQDIQEQATTAPRDGVEKDSTSGTT